MSGRKGCHAGSVVLAVVSRSLIPSLARRLMVEILSLANASLASILELAVAEAVPLALELTIVRLSYDDSRERAVVGCDSPLPWLLLAGDPRGIGFIDEYTPATGPAVRFEACAAFAPAELSDRVGDGVVRFLRTLSVRTSR